jgi:hypothetical protein
MVKYVTSTIYNTIESKYRPLLQTVTNSTAKKTLNTKVQIVPTAKHIDVLTKTWKDQMEESISTTLQNVNCPPSHLHSPAKGIITLIKSSEVTGPLNQMYEPKIATHPTKNPNPPPTITQTHIHSKTLISPLQSFPHNPYNHIALSLLLPKNHHRLQTETNANHVNGSA